MYVFIAVAERRSFSRAAADLGVTKATVSQTVRALEERLGLRLLNRNTRSVALTEIGERMYGRMKPILAAFDEGMEEIKTLGGVSAGHLRLKVVPTAAHMIVSPLLPLFQRLYPEIIVEISISHDQEDLIEGHFDAGIRHGYNIDRDMLRIPLSTAMKPIVAASEDYLAKWPRPKTPADLLGHNCIPLRLPNGSFSRWRFSKDGTEFDVAASGSPVVDSAELMLKCALDGLGLCYIHPFWAIPAIKREALVAVLDDWTAALAGFHLYFPGRRQQPAPLLAFINFMKAHRAELDCST